MARDMKNVCSGAQRDEGKTWFSELADKGTGIFSFCNFCFCCWFFFSLQLKFVMFFTQPKPPKHISTGQ